ncbi:U3 snoRNP-associated protein-like YAOH [Dendrobium catenatum]|uniref:Guanine nucleotide-binding protein subunit beta-like protein C n=1 Tax=Dendrobium catenatum TaxID=906689 RepID=A0A2I0W125_9ASPA|nr:U3 snoRNP-associated protein-like YAOH [Dendrobium catenatum]PKU69362.1 Guanine nucleotide-binding protein subunit beta-like protein C [Dendrobium catenatum]
MKRQRVKNFSRTRGGKKKPKSISNGDDPFFEADAKRRRKGVTAFNDKEEVESLPSDESEAEVVGGEDQGEEPEETAAETRFRMAKEHLERIRAAAKKLEEEEGVGEGDEINMEEREGRRDSLVAEILQKDQLEASGRVRRLIASRVLNPEPDDEFKVLVKHRMSVTAVGLAEDDRRGFSASKDGTILHWDVESGKHEKYLWPNEDVLISHRANGPQNSTSKRSKNVLSLAVSSDGRYLASGGLDRDVHLWDTRTREHIQAFRGHRGPVTCLTFRQGTPQLFSGSFDRTIKLWNVEDRTHMDNLFGHQSEVLTIDCLHKERLLTVGRDRTMRLWKVPEESQLVFRAPASSLECCCFINDSEFLSGSDDGSIELWSILRKKPIHIIKNAHALLSSHDEHLPTNSKEGLPNGNHAGGCSTSVQSWVSSVAVCRGSDLVASGAANGVIRLWNIASDDKNIQPLLAYPLVGFANSLAFSKSGRFILAGVGQEPRLGRWGRVHNARNGVAVHSIRLSEEHSALY